MFIPEQLKKEALRRVRTEIEKEILGKLKIQVSVDTDSNMGRQTTKSITAVLTYNDKEVCSDTEILE